MIAEQTGTCLTCMMVYAPVFTNSTLACQLIHDTCSDLNVTVCQPLLEQWRISSAVWGSPASSASHVRRIWEEIPCFTWQCDSNLCDPSDQQHINLLPSYATSGALLQHTTIHSEMRKKLQSKQLLSWRSDSSWGLGMVCVCLCACCFITNSINVPVHTCLYSLYLHTNTHTHDLKATITRSGHHSKHNTEQHQSDWALCANPLQNQKVSHHTLFTRGKLSISTSTEWLVVPHSGVPGPPKVLGPHPRAALVMHFMVVLLSEPQYSQVLLGLVIFK